MSAHFDKCPICGKAVGYEDAAGENHDMCIAMCINGHTVIDLGVGYTAMRSNEFQAARIWNKAVRKYKNERSQI